MTRRLNICVTSSLLAIGVLGGCQSTPEHTNTLIFGTNTKIALDVSQDPTGVVGVTLGYKRQEAVWMPLLANSRGTATSAQPADCKDASVVKIEQDGKTTTKTSGCKFSGTAGSDSTNGAGAEDTYSVLATFSGEGKGVAGTSTSAAKPEASAGGALAQFFATGMAARLLAEQGSSIVNTSGGSKSSNANTPKLTDSAQKTLAAETVVVNRVMFAVTDKNGVLEKSKLDALASKATFSDTSIKGRVTNAKDTTDLRDYLSDTYEAAAKPLFNAIP